MSPAPGADSSDFRVGFAGLRSTGDWAPPGWVDVVVEGPDAGSYLQGQLSQDVAALAVGGTAWSLLLEPSGKLGSWLHVRRLAAERFVLEVDPATVDAVLARLNRFKLRTDATIALTGADLGSTDPSAVTGGAQPEGGAPLDGASRAEDEAARIEAGVPRAGAEVSADVIPAELGGWLIDRSVSFTKGCYTGQELVARIDSRGGNVPRHLRGLLVAGETVPPVGAEIVVDGLVVGSITSAAHSARLAAPVALGFVKRTVEPPTAAVVTWDGGSAPAEIRVLPLHSS